MSVNLTRPKHSFKLTKCLEPNHMSCTDITIVGKDNETIQTNVLNLALSSYYMEDLIFTATNGQTTDPVTLYLIDYSVELINFLLDYICTGIANCTNKVDYDDLIELINILQIKSVSSSSNGNDVKPEFPCRVIKEEKFEEDDENDDDFSASNSPETPVDVSIYVEEPYVGLENRVVNEMEGKVGFKNQCYLCEGYFSSDPDLINHFHKCTSQESTIFVSKCQVWQNLHFETCIKKTHKAHASQSN